MPLTSKSRLRRLHNKRKKHDWRIHIERDTAMLYHDVYKCSCGAYLYGTPGKNGYEVPVMGAATAIMSKRPEDAVDILKHLAYMIENEEEEKWLWGKNLYINTTISTFTDIAIKLNGRPACM